MASSTCNVANNSNQPWTIKADGRNIGSGQTGTVYFTGNAGCSGNGTNGPFIVGAQNGATMEFDSTAGVIVGTLTITDHFGNEESYNYSNTTTGSDTVTIGHNGSTGNVTLNEPNNGSVIITADCW